MRRRSILSRGAAAAAIFAAPAILGIISLVPVATAAPGAGTLYGTDAAGGHLLQIDPATGAGIVVGALHTPAGDLPGFPALAVSPITGKMYGGEGRGTANFYEIDASTALATLIANTGLGFATITGLDFRADGVLYASINIAGDGGTGGDHLATINENTGAVTIIGPFGACTGVTVPTTGGGSCTIEGIEGIAFDSFGTLWAVHNARSSAGPAGLYTIDTMTGAATFKHPVTDGAGHQLSGGLVSLQYHCDGRLFGGSARSAPGANDGGRLVTLDPLTGIGAFVGALPATPSTTSLGALAFASSCGPPPQEPRSSGFWKHQCTGFGFTQVDASELSDLFGDVAADSGAFGECAAADCSVLEFSGPQSQMRPKLERQGLALWLNIISGRLPASTPVDLAPLTTAMTVGEAVLEVDATICNPSASKTELENSKDIAETLNLGGIDLELAAEGSLVEVPAGQSASLKLAVINMSPLTRSYTLSANGPWPVILSQTQVTNLKSGGVSILSAQISAPSTVPQGTAETFTFTAVDSLSGSEITRVIAVTGFVTGSGSGGGDQKTLQLKEGN